MRLNSLTFLACVGALVAAAPAALPSAAEASYGAVPADSAAKKKKCKKGQVKVKVGKRVSCRPQDRTSSSHPTGSTTTAATRTAAAASRSRGRGS